MATLNNATLTASSISNSSDNAPQLTGWVPSDTHRGSIEILWSCCITILLCCWVSTFPNVPSPKDKWYHSLVDKFNLACIGSLGPDYLFGIALGQLSSARRSVKLFRELPQPAHGEGWTLVHGFYADMGGFHLGSPDFSPFPVNSEQLCYLVKHGHVDFPSLRKSEIKAASKTDGLSKLITLWQVFWFSVSELQRVREGLPMTTFELTALSFSITMLITSLCWYAKPTISRPTILGTKDGRTIESIRAMARESTHPGLPSTWYRTPLDFISPMRRFRVDVHWAYYSRLTYMVHVPIFSREITALPWDRFPSDTWLLIEPPLLIPGFFLVAAFGVCPLLAWNFHFPSEGEKIAWRVCSVYHATFSLGVTLYYIYVVLFKLDKAAGKPQAADERPVHPPILTNDGPRRPTHDRAHSEKTFDVECSPVPPVEGGTRLKTVLRSWIGWLRRWRNISRDGDPDMELPVHATFPPLVGTFLYIFCRLYFYVEDFVSIRQQPVGVYTAMNKFLPFIS